MRRVPGFPLQSGDAARAIRGVVRGAKQALRLLAPAIVLAIAGGCSGGGSGEGPASQPPAISISGTPDATYGTGGRLVVPSYDIAVDRGGNVFASDTVVRKFDPNGLPAADFLDRIPTSGSQSRVAVDVSGNVFSVFSGADGHWIVAKRDNSGRPAQTFGQSGRVDLDAVWNFTAVASLFADGAGNLYVSGISIPPGFPRPVTNFVAKLDVSGRPVTTFGTSGDGRLFISSVFEQPPAVTVDGSGNIYAALPANIGNAFVAKFDANGVPVHEFMTGPTAIPCASTISTPFWTIAVDPSGNIYVGGACSWDGETRNRVFVVKLDASGNAVSSFGNGGVAADFYVFPANAASQGLDVGSTYLMRIVAAAGATVYLAVAGTQSGCSGTAIANLGADGKLVDAFGAHGVVVTRDLAATGLLALDSAGRLYAGGLTHPVCPFTTPITYAVDRFNG